MALTKAEIADYLTFETDVQLHQAKELVDGFFEVLREVLEDGQNAKISGFGNFELRDKPPRPGRNPKTGVEVEIAARRVVTFKAGHKLKAQVNCELQVAREREAAQTIREDKPSGQSDHES